MIKDIMIALAFHLSLFLLVIGGAIVCSLTRRVIQLEKDVIELRRKLNEDKSIPRH